MDKVDLDVLLLDTKVYVSTLWRLCHEPQLPMHFGPVVADIQQTLQELQGVAGNDLDLSQLQARADSLATAVAQLAKATPTTADAIRRVNAQCKALSRALIPITYTAAGHFDHDPAWPMPHIPLLRDLPKLAQLDPASDEYQFLRTQLVRNRNAVSFALRQALAVLA